jgi:nucleoside-diphosphate-sugar epimerase
MHYVVTGGAGFIGSHLVEHLVTAAGGHRVTVLDNFSTGKRENLAPWADRIRVVEGSVTDPDACREGIAGADFVLHQAALPSVPRSLRDPMASHEANTTGTLNVLIAARDAHVKRVVYAASSSAYGTTAELPKREDMLPRPLSPYAAAKYAGEQYCRAFHASFGLGTIALRYFNVFGPRQDPTSQYAAVIPKFIVCAQSGEPPTIFGDGEQTRDFTFVADVVEAFRSAARSSWCGVANVGGGARRSMRDVLAIVESICGTVRIEHRPPEAGDVRDTSADTSTARSAFGYEPAVSLADGLAAMIAWRRGRILSTVR